MAMEQTAEEPREFVDELKPGTQLLQGQYTIVKFINAGGFGITYLAKNSLGREVVIKECFPGSFCRRSYGRVAARSRAHENEFAQIVKLFVQEAKSLSRLIHPNIVGVHQVFEDNDTAYMAIDYIEGRDLLDIIERDRLLLRPAIIAMMLKKLLGAVAFIHDNGMLHRDISPDNILISRAGEPVLIDFGAARQQATRIGSKALSALRVVKDGYSPQEFYVSGTQQSPSSDLYALAASFYHLISGETPPNSQTRLVAIAENGEDPYEPLAGRIEGYPDGFLEAIDDAVSVLPKDRIQSAREWLDRIAARPELKVVPMPGREQAAPEAAAAPAPGAPAAETTTERPRRGLGGTAALLLGTAVIAGAVGYLLLDGPPAPAPEAAEETAALVPAPATPEPATPEPEAAASGPQAATVQGPAPAPEPSAPEAASPPPASAPEPVAPEVAPEPVAPEVAAESAVPEIAEPEAEVTAAEAPAPTAVPALVPEPEAEPEPNPEPGAAAAAAETLPALPEGAEPEEPPAAAEAPAAPAVTAPAAETAALPEPSPAPEPAVAPAPAVLPEVEAPAPRAVVEPETAAALEPLSDPEPRPESTPPAALEPAAAPEAANISEATPPAAPAPEVVAAAPEAAPVAPAPVAAPEPAAEPAPAPEPEPMAEAPEAEQPEPVAEPPATAAADAMVAEARALTDDGVAMRQVVFAGWDAELPFETTTVGDADAFPMISRVLEGANRRDENGWIAEGVTIYAINDTFVSDQAAIERVLADSAEFGVDLFHFASVRIKTDPEAKFEEVTLAVRTRLSVDLANGVSFRTEPGDGAWQTVITAVASPEEHGLQVGDVVLSELVSGEELTSSRTLEFAVNRLARAHRPVAVFAVERNGQSTVARMSLAREN